MKVYGLILAVAWCYIGITDGAAKPRVITGNLNFVYDPNSHYFSVQTPSKCYMVLLSRSEREHVISRTGLQDMELKMMREWIGVLNETLVFHTDPNLPLYFQSHCKGQDILYMARTLPPETGGFQSVIG